jgi:hypothetical protein
LELHNRFQQMTADYNALPASQNTTAFGHSGKKRSSRSGSAWARDAG